MAAACCGLRRRRRKKSAAEPRDSRNADAFTKLSSVVTVTELETVTGEILGETAKCSSLRFHYNEASPLAAAAAAALPRIGAVPFTSGRIGSLSHSNAIVCFTEAAAKETELAELMGDSQDGLTGVVLPISESGKPHCLITFFAEEVGEAQTQTFESLRKQLESTCSRLVRLANLGFTGAAMNSNGTPADQALQQHRQQQQQQQQQLQQLQEERHPILKLCAELYDQDSEHLQLKVIKHLTGSINCETGFLLLVSQDRANVFCQVVGDRVLENEVHISAHMNFFGSIIASSKSYWLEEIPEDCLSDLLSLLGSGATVKSLLCVPVVSRGVNQVIAVSCMVNKRGGAFTQSDVDLVHECFRYTSSVLTSTVAFQTERMLKNQTQALLQVAQNIFRKLDDLTVLLREIMAEARKLTQAERCSVFLLDKDTNELVAKVFDGLPTTSGEKNEQPVEIRIPATHGIAGRVATEGKLLNIKDAYKEPLFYSKVDEDTGFRTRNILCFPIQDEHGNVVGVAQLCNKINAAHFSTFDEDIARAFSVYCCISIIHSLMYKKVQAAQARHQLATELMTYHMHVPERDVSALASRSTKPKEQYFANFDQFASVPRHVRECEMCESVICMFEDLNFVRNWRIRRSTLARFVLLVRKGYRDPPYHNWSHAFSVAHFTYLCLKNLNLQRYLTPLERFAFLVASLCHDIDHRGTNNSFENSSGSALSGLYSSEGSVLERHHFSQTVCVLSREGCNVFENLSEKEYCAALDIVRNIILATDVAHHLKIKKEIDQLVEQPIDNQNERHRELLLCLLMTASDISDQTKVWKNTRQVAKLIYQEFFSLGDKEKSLGRQPAEGMDRDKADIPQLQINFLNIIAAPVYQSMEKVWPQECSVLTRQVQRNIDNWRLIRDKFDKGEVERNDETIFERRLVPDDE